MRLQPGGYHNSRHRDGGRGLRRHGSLPVTNTQIFIESWETVAELPVCHLWKGSSASVDADRPMICDGDRTVVNLTGAQLESLHDVEALCLEICAELREVVEMLATYRDIIGNAARLTARAARYPLIGGSEAAELARELARMAYIEEEIDRLLSSEG